MKKHFKILLAFVLSIAMVVTHIPIIAAEDVIAASEESVTVEEPNTQVTEEKEEAYILGEFKDKRSNDTKHFRMSDGSIKACIYPQNVHYLKSGKYEDIDNTLVYDEEKGIYTNKENSARVTLPEDFANGYVEYSTDNGFVKFRLVGSSSKKIQKITSTKLETEDVTVLNKVNSRASYDAVKTDIDIQYDIIGNVLKETIVLNKKTNEAFVFEILTSAYNVVLNNDNSISFFDEEGTQIYRMESPYMRDSAGEYTNSVNVELLKKSNIYYLAYDPDYDWLSDENRAFPVYLDPTLCEFITGSSVSDTYVSSGVGSDDIRGGWDVLNIGIAQVSNGDLYTMRAYLKFDIPSQIKPTDRIVSAKLDMIHYDQSVYISYSDLRIDVHELTSSFTEGGTWWGNKPSFDSTVIDYVNVDTSNFLGDTGLTHDSYDITKLVNKWHADSEMNRGLMLKLHDETSPTSNYKVFYYASDSIYHGETSKFIEIVYRDTSGLEDYWTYISLPAGRYGMAYVNSYSGNLVVTQPDYAIDGNRMPVSLSHIYNTSSDVVDTYGGRWRLNYQMCIQTPSGLEYPCFVDADGTKHYFYQETSTSPVIDEDGLGYTLTTDSSSTAERYVLTDKSKNKTYFNSDGKLTKLSDSVGNSAVIEYDSVGNISTITDGAGRVYTLTYASGKLSSLTAPDGKIVQYTYNSSNQLSEIIYPDGPKTTFTYTTDGFVEYINRPDGQNLNFMYRIRQPFEVSWNDSYNDTIELYHLSFDYNNTVITDDTSENTKKYQYQFDVFGHTTGIVNIQGNQAQHYVYNGVSEGGKSHKVTSESKIQKSIVNLLPNHRLDFGPYNFEVYETAGQNVTYTYDYDFGNLTYGSYKVSKNAVSDSDSYAFIENSYVATKTGYYTFSSYVNTKGVSLPGNGAVVRLERVVDGENLGGVQRSVNYTSESEWQRVSVTYYFEQGDTILCLIGTNGAQSLGDMWFDEYQLEEGETVNSYNLLHNSGFNGGLSDWSLSGMTAYHVTITDSYFPQGNPNGMKIVDEDTYDNLNNYSAQDIYILDGKAGDVFSVGGWAKAESVTTDTSNDTLRYLKRFSIRLEVSFDDGTTDTYQLSFNCYCDDWQFMSKQIIMPKDYNGIRLSLDYRRNANTCIFTLPYLYKEDYGQTYTYDDDGNIISSVDLAASETNFAYNDNQLSKIFSPSGSNYSYTYDEVNNLLKYAISSDGLMEEFTYDSAGNALSATTWSMPVVSTLTSGKTYYIVNAQTRTTLTAMGEAIRSQIQGQSFEKDNEHQKWTLTATSDGYYNIDAYLGSSNANFRLDVPDGADTNDLGMIIHNPNTSNAQKYQITQNADGTFSIYTCASNFTKCLDALSDNTSGAGNGIQVVQSTYSADNKAQKWYFYEVDSVTSGSFIKSTAEYTEDKNYLLKTTDAFGNVTQYTYNTTSGLLEKVIDPEGNETVYAYNTDNSLKSVTSSNGGLSSAVNYTYQNDALTKIEVTGGTVYNFVYDSFGRTDKIKVKDAVLSDLVYNSSGLIERMNYGNGAYISYVYDNMNRVTQKIYNGDNTKRVEYYYNASGNLGIVVDYIANETTRYIYDLSSRLVEIEVYGTASITDTNVVKSIKYTYADKTNYLTEVEYDSLLGTQTYSYNYGDMSSGQMPDAVYSVGYNGTTQLEYTYDDFGRLTERKLSPINKTMTFTYKQGGHGADSTSAMVASVAIDVALHNYNYDANGNIREVYYHDLLQQYYEYDSKNQLTEYGDFWGPLYNYSYSNGNITTVIEEGVTTKTFSYTDTNWPDKLTAVNGNTITYDNIGNPLVYHDGRIFTWTNGRWLSSVNKNGSTFTYTYDGDGIRTSKKVYGETTEFIYADGVLVGQKTGNNTLIFLYDESGNKYGFVYNGVNYYYDINLQGDVIAIYDSTGTKVVYYEYDPWGNILSVSGSLRDTIGAINPIRYRGYYYDKETGFYYLQSRYYDPGICRFISADGLVSTGQDVTGYNMFAYCNNNPVNNYDDTGLFLKKVSNFFNKVTKVIRKCAEKFANAVAKSFVAEIGFGPGVGGSTKVGSYEVSATAYHDNVTFGMREGELYTSIKGKADISIMGADDIGTGFTIEYEHFYEKSGLKTWDIHTTESTPWSVYFCDQTIRDWQFLFLNNNIVEGENLDAFFGKEHSIHIGYGGHYMIGWDLNTFVKYLFK